MKPKISIIVPVYNGEKYIERCFNSIKNQTFKELEIIFVNDGSDDNSKYILDKIKAVNSNVIVYHQENNGPGAARNKGIELANGEFITFIDIDDCINAHMYMKMYRYIEDYNVDLVVCGQEVILANGETKEFIIPQYPKDVYLIKDEIRQYIIKPILKDGPGLLAPQWNKLYRKSIINDNKIKVDEKRRFGEDWFFNQLFIGKVDRIAFVKEALYKYIRSNEESLSSQYLKNSFELFKESRVFRKQRMIEWKLNSNEDILTYNTYFCKDIYTRVILNEVNKENKIGIKLKYKNIKKYLNDVEVKEAFNNCYIDSYTKILINNNAIKILFIAYFDYYIRPILSKVKKIIY